MGLGPKPKTQCFMKRQKKMFYFPFCIPITPSLPSFFSAANCFSHLPCFSDVFFYTSYSQGTTNYPKRSHLEKERKKNKDGASLVVLSRVLGVGRIIVLILNQKERRQTSHLPTWVRVIRTNLSSLDSRLLHISPSTSTLPFSWILLTDATFI